MHFLRRYVADEMEFPPLSCKIEQEVSAAKPQAFPQLFSVGRRFYYALVFTENEMSLIGPVRLAAPLHLFRDIPDENNGKAGQVRQLPPCDVPIFFQSVLLLHNICHDIPVSQHELLMANCSTKNMDEVLQDSTKLIFDNRELGKRHNSYQQEQRLMESIEQGDMQMLQTCRQDNVLADDFGKLAPEMDRSIRNVCNSVITLASRAAIRGGVHPELAFSLCDTYITKIEEIKDLLQVQVVVEGAEAHFTRMVNALRKTPLPREDNLRHPLVEKSKDYIYSHLHGKIVLNDVAALLGTNPSYLSELFKHYEVLVLNLRCKVACGHEERTAPQVPASL